MPTVLDVNQIWQLRVVCYTADQIAVNTAHYRVTAVTGGGAVDSDAAVSFDTALNGVYKATISAQARYRGVSLQRVMPAPPTRPARVVVSDGVGAIAGDMMAKQVSGIISTGTELAGRSQRGRVYIPFPGEPDNQANGTPTPGYVTAVQAIANVMFSSRTLGIGGATSAVIPVLWHRGSLTWDEVTHKDAKPFWATQRRRGNYGRVNSLPF